jgi:hypothetical protein
MYISGPFQKLIFPSNAFSPCEKLFGSFYVLLELVEVVVLVLVLVAVVVVVALQKYL